MKKNKVVEVGDIFELDINRWKQKGYIRVLGLKTAKYKLPYIEFFIIDLQKKEYTIDELRNFQTDIKFICYKECFKEWEKIGNIQTDSNDENSFEIINEIFPPLAIRFKYLQVLMLKGILGEEALQHTRNIWGVEIFESVTADEVWCYFDKAYKESQDVAKATKVVVDDSFLATYNSGYIRVKIMFLIMAKIQLEFGQLEDRIKNAALKVIDDETALEPWMVNESIFKHRKFVLEELKQKLLSYQI